MKRTVLLLSLGAGMAALTLSSYGSGPFQGGAGNRTGSAGSPAECSSGGCHSANSSNTMVTIVVTTQAGQPVSAYTPGIVYKVTVGGTNTSSLPRFGFQASCVKATATNVQAGTFATTASNTSLRNAGSLQLVEHNTPILGITPGVYAASFNWTAPASGTGTVRFYSTLNAVNFNGSTTGDQPNTAAPLNLPEASSNGIESAAVQQLALYPNPATNELRMKLAGSGSAELKVWDLSGRIVLSHTASVVVGEARLDVSMLSPGQYVLSASQNGLQFAAPFVKQ